MPEGHLYHRLARLQQELVGVGPIEVSSPQGKFADGAAALDGRPLEAVTARGKNLFHHFGDDVIHVHLGMQGIFLRGDGTTEPKKQVRLRLQRPGVANWDLIAPITCALLTTEEHDHLIGHLGPDPLDPTADEQRAIDNLRRSGSTIGAALLDQKVISGVGNVFRAEALLVEHIHPTARSEDLSVEQLSNLWRTLRELMHAGEEAGEITPKRIYKQQNCAECGTATTTSTVAGRTAYTCTTCQPVQRAA
ncbi:MAG TPA: DNA-formamidopyrimidine glycosylase family protein [Acidimicrobiales bacterium]|jgi:endonuclease VIII|nr:DNA-formamidopyrimidine glycosylase family protein [Acidimicrobiales bacterium]